MAKTERQEQAVQSPAIVDTVEALQARIQEVREAAKNFCNLFAGAG